MADLNTTESSLLVSVVGADANGAETTPLVVNPDGSINVVLFGGPNIKVSSDDQTLGFLEQKVVGTPNKIEVTTINPGADEDLKINIGSDVFDKSVDDASDVTNIPSGNISATTVQAAINELDAEKQPLDATLTALAAYNTNGLLTQTAPNTFVGRTIEGTVGNINVLQGDGVAANPRIDLADIGTPGSLGDSNKTLIISVDEKGRVNGLIETPISIPSTQVSDFTEAVQDVIGNAISDSISIDFNYNDAGNTITASVIPSAIDHNQLANLDVGDVHTQYVRLNGRNGGQTVNGGQGANEDLILDSTNSSTKGDVLINPSGGMVGVRTPSPITEFSVVTNTDAQIRGISVVNYANSTRSGRFMAAKARGSETTPSPALSADVLGSYSFFGRGTTAFQQGASIRAVAQQNVTDTAAGTNLEFQTAANNSVTMVTNLAVTQDGQTVATKNLRVGDNTVSSTNGDIRYAALNNEFLGRQNGVWRCLTINPTTVTATADTATTSGTYATIGSMTQTPTAGIYEVEFLCSARLGDDTSADIRITVGGTEQTAYTMTLAIDAVTLLGAAAGYEVPVFIKIPSVTVNGSQAINVEFRENGGGTLTIGPRSLTTTPIAR